LTEAGLLPGVLLNNSSGRFQCQDVKLKIVNNDTPFTNLYQNQEIVTMPIAHAMGNYTVAEKELESLKANKQIIFEYTEDVNGSISQIAGVSNKNKNVIGLMPHPERCCEKELGGVDGLKLFQSILRVGVTL
jgi:phosphoribosylformylglycinamidine synthase